MFSQQKVRERNHIIIFLVCLFVSSMAFSSCSGDRTYDVDEKDGVRYIHNFAPKFDKPIAELKFIQQLRSNDPEIGYNKWPKFKNRKHNKDRR